MHRAIRATGVISLLLWTLPVSASLLDFESAEGVPFSGPVDGFFYTAYDGIEIHDSDGFTFSSFVQLCLCHPDLPSDITGYYLNVGSFLGVTTFVDFFLDSWAIAFDFATHSGIVTVEAWDDSGALLGAGRFAGASPFLTPASRFVAAGSVELAGLGRLARVRVTAPDREGLIIDNVEFEALGRDPGSGGGGGGSVPEPASGLILAIGLFVLLRRP